jgi:hypothetical protein
MVPKCFSECGLIAVAALLISVMTGRAEDVTLSVWSHEADEDAKRRTG